MLSAITQALIFLDKKSNRTGSNQRNKIDVFVLSSKKNNIDFGIDVFDLMNEV